jgi:glutamate-5-semialdehyde dehydrogenase
VSETVPDVRQHALALAAAARQGARALAQTPTAAKNRTLTELARRLGESRSRLQEANRKDLEAGRARGLTKALRDRLELTDRAIEAMAEGVLTIAELPDPVGEALAEWVRPNGVTISKVRVPIGVILFIYESRPNVTVDAFALCLKSGNAVILRGGSEAFHSNQALLGVIRESLDAAGVSEDAAQMVATTDRAAVGELLRLHGEIDLVIPRGGYELIRRVTEESRIPVIKHYAGVCHTYVDATADLNMAEEVCFNAKVQRPAVCNAMETLLVHEAVAAKFLPAMAQRFLAAGVELRGCPRTRALVPQSKAATEESWRTEYLDLVLNVKVVDSLDEAVAHISTFGTQHSDAIITLDEEAAERFAREVDSAAVFVNCSTRLHDGGEFGFGAEVGISTDRIHARGPMALPELTIYKYIVRGTGQLRQ